MQWRRPEYGAKSCGGGHLSVLALVWGICLWRPFLPSSNVLCAGWLSHLATLFLSDLGIALAASLCPALGVNQLPGLVMSASLIPLKSTYFSLFLLQLPCVRLPSAPAWIIAKPIFEPFLGLQPHSSICSYPVARTNLFIQLPWLIVFHFEVLTPNDPDSACPIHPSCSLPKYIHIF